MKEYKIAKGWAIFIYLASPFMLGLFGWLLILPFTKENLSLNAIWILAPVSLAMIALLVVGVIDTYKARLLISEDSISSISIFFKRFLKIKDIKGYTVNEKYIFIEPKDKNQKRIKVSNYIGGYNEILFWLSQTFTNLDEQTAIDEEQEILSDENYGLTKDIREEKLIKARQTAKIINWAGGITTAWLFFYPTPYQYAILIAIAIPIIALLAVKFSAGLIRANEKKGSAFPSVIHAFIYPSLGLLLRAIADYDIFDYSNVWLTTTLMTLFFLALLLVKQKEITFKKKTDYVTVPCLALFLFAYSFGTVIHINCFYDKSGAQNFTSKVLNKRITSGKTTTRYLELSTWGQQKERDEVSVEKDFYNSTEIGDEVKISFRKGNLDIPWFTVTGE